MSSTGFVSRAARRAQGERLATEHSWGGGVGWQEIQDREEVRRVEADRLLPRPSRAYLIDPGGDPVWQRESPLQDFGRHTLPLADRVHANVLRVPVLITRVELIDITQYGHPARAAMGLPTMSFLAVDILKRRATNGEEWWWEWDIAPAERYVAEHRNK